MKDIWIISDTHFGHENILKFTDNYGVKFRGDIFRNLKEMDEHMIAKWNTVVRPTDKVYHLGDFFMGSNLYGEEILKQLNGHKNLILGNHDKVTRDSPHHRYFEKIMLWWPFEQFIFSHVPLREDSFPTRNNSVLNVHGHIHEKPSPTLGHFNVSVENINYTPIHIDALRSILTERKFANEGYRTSFNEQEN